MSNRLLRVDWSIMKARVDRSPLLTARLILNAVNSFAHSNLILAWHTRSSMGGFLSPKATTSCVSGLLKLKGVSSEVATSVVGGLFKPKGASPGDPPQGREINTIVSYISLRNQSQRFLNPVMVGRRIVRTLQLGHWRRKRLIVEFLVDHAMMEPSYVLSLT